MTLEPRAPSSFSAASSLWCVQHHVQVLIFSFIQVDDFETINLTMDELREWKSTLGSFIPPLVSLESVDLHFVWTLWKLFCTRKYE